jgi:phage nucleotide-binding protein
VPDETPPPLGGKAAVKAQTIKEPHSLMFYGRPKIGKTSIAASISEVPGFKHVLLLDLEMGAGAIAETFPTVDVREINDYNEFEDVFNDALDDAAQNYYDAIILDTMSTLQRWITRKSSGGKKPSYDDWAYTYDMIMEIMWAMHRMSAVGITLVHTQTKENELTKEVWTMPWLQGSAASAIGNVPDLIGFIDVKDTVNGPIRTLQLAPKKTMVTGNRFEDRVPVKVEDMLLPDLYAIIRKEIETAQ